MGKVIGTADIFHLADILGKSVTQDGHKLTIQPIHGTVKTQGFPLDYVTVHIDGVVCKEYAAVDLHVGGDLHLYVLIGVSNYINQPTFLFISSKSPTEPLQGAFRTTTDPIPMGDLLDLLKDEIQKGFYTDDRKKWRALPEAAHLDLFERKHLDAGFWKLLQNASVARS